MGKAARGQKLCAAGRRGTSYACINRTQGTSEWCGRHQRDFGNSEHEQAVLDASASDRCRFPRCPSAGLPRGPRPGYCTEHST